MALHSDYDEEFEEGKVEGRHTFDIGRIVIAAIAGGLSVLFVLSLI